MKNKKKGSESSPKPQKTSKNLFLMAYSFVHTRNGRASKAQIARQFVRYSLCVINVTPEPINV